MAGARFLAVQLDGRALLIDARVIQEVIGQCESVDVPHQSGELDGIFLWNGRAIPLVSLGNLASSGSEQASLSSHSARKRKRTLIFHAAGEWAGLAVDDASEIVELTQAQLLPVRHNPGPFATHEVDDGETIRSVIDLHAVVSRILALSSQRDGAFEQAQVGSGGAA